MNKYQTILSATATSLAMLAVSLPSQAAIVAADLTAIETEVSADASLVFTTFLPVIGTVLAMIIGIKLVKRFGNKV
jgi:hypothetical protein